MVEIYQKILSQEKVNKLLDYFFIEDDRTDDRPDVRSKHPIWNETSWPQNIVKNVLDKICDNYSVEEVLFFDTKISYGLHVDSGKEERSRNGKVIIFPLLVDGIGSTALFDNHWYHDSTRFSQVKIEPFEYNLPNTSGSWTYVKDLRILLDQCLKNPKAINDFIVDKEFISTLQYLIETKQDKKISKVDGRCYDYTNIVGYDSNKLFDNEIYHRYFTHMPIENLHGLTLNSMIYWSIGNCFVFDRTQLHCAGGGHKRKIGLTIFTQKIN